MTVQLALGLRLRDDATFKNFYGGSNHAVLHHLQHCVSREGENFIYIFGASGVGVSHLLQASCHLAFSLGQRAFYLPLSEPGITPMVLQDLETFDLICLDDVDSAWGHKNWEESLLHLYNRVRQRDARLIIAARPASRQSACQLADLRSRLSWGLEIHLADLSDEEKMHALQMRAEERGLTLSVEASQFVLRHCSRNMAQLFQLLETLDHASLVAKRRLTVPFIKKILANRA